jgi:hypothetical protein
VSSCLPGTTDRRCSHASALHVLVPGSFSRASVSQRAVCSVLPMLQATKLPDRYCDDRVRIVQGDARLLSPAFWEQESPEVHWRVGGEVVSVHTSWMLWRGGS